MAALRGAVARAPATSSLEPVEWKRDQALKFVCARLRTSTPLMGIAEVTTGLMAQKKVIITRRLDGRRRRQAISHREAATAMLTAIGSW